MRLLYTIAFILVIALILPTAPALAQETPVVHLVFFFNPDCENCHQVMTNDLPPLQAQYGNQLDILQVDTTKPEGLQLYQDMYRHFELSDERLGTPAIVIGKSVLVGADEIPAKLPGLIAEGLAKGGVSWPDIPDLASFINNAAITKPYPGPHIYPQPVVQDSGTTQSTDSSTWERFSNNFKKDPVANSLAVAVLAGMIISILFVLGILIQHIFTENPKPVSSRNSIWLIPLLIIVGLGVAVYLTYIETSKKIAICGPIGHCNEVQNSPYAKLFGILPVGELGLIGYASLLVAWGVYKWGPKGLRFLSALALWGMSLFGVVFSIYLTFLEPFVIGATCMWCISSALIMTALLWVTTPIIQETLTIVDNPDEEQPASLDT
jgi:uncharacterized membrane protein